MGRKKWRSEEPQNKSEKYVNGKLFGSNFVRKPLSEESAGRILTATEAVFQRERGSQEIFVPTVRGFFDKLVDGERKLKEPSGDLEKIAANFAPDRCIVPPTYKGVSYNPLLLQSGERFDMLDFFSWGKAVQEKENKFRFLVLDATLYWIVNAIGRMPIKTYSKDAAAQVVDELKKELKTNEIAGQIIKASELRNKYLLAMASLFPNGSCQVVTAKDLWYGNDSYLKALQFAIDYVVEWPFLQTDGFEFKFGQYAQYSRYNQEYQKWYTPLVLGEAKYLYDAYGISAKLGPTSETAFDSLIRGMMGAGRKTYLPDPNLGGGIAITTPIPYDIFWYTRPLESKIPYSEYVFFNDSDAIVKEKIAGNSQLAKWLAEIVKPFVGEVKTKEVAEAVNGLKNRINGLAENPPAPPSTPGDWWFLWPPGSCG